MQNSIIKTYKSSAEFLKLFRKEDDFDESLFVQVREIIAQVRKEGDKAIFNLTKKYDHVNRESLTIDEVEWKSIKQIEQSQKELFTEAAKNIRQFHQKEFEPIQDWFLQSNGCRVGQKVVPIQRVGVYVPGGTAAYPSSVLMNVIPAQIAGVEEIVLVSPPDQETGQLSPYVLAIADLLNIKEIYAIGGAQAIAALAYGTESIKPVDKITGPGNRFVAEAKRQVFGKVGIDSIAGPSEIVIIADDSANPEFLAADLLSQAEHDNFAQSILISNSDQIILKTKNQLEIQLANLPRLKIAQYSLENYGALVQVEDLTEGLELVNQIAPEHLELQVVNPDLIFGSVKNAGAVFLGPYTPEPVGDYWAGSNHILPTSANARFASALSVRDFLKWISVVEYSKEKLKNEGEKIIQFAKLEKLDAHAKAVELRLNN
jgi:histidinol dehydrogenase